MTKIARKTITQEEIIWAFAYKDGFLYWKNINKFSNKKIGDLAGRINGDRRSIGINNQVFYAARLIFLYHKGYLPNLVDHDDRDTLNDKIENLRDASYSQNVANSTKIKNKTSIYKGVSTTTIKHSYGSYLYWNCLIYINGVSKFIGAFKNEKDAALAYNREAVRAFGEFANLNIIEP